MTQLSKSAEHHHFRFDGHPDADVRHRIPRSSIYGLVIQGVGVVFYLVWRATAASARVAAPAE